MPSRYALNDRIARLQAILVKIGRQPSNVVDAEACYAAAEAHLDTMIDHYTTILAAAQTASRELR